MSSTKLLTSLETTIYRGEGNRNFILSIPEKKKVIRIRKTYVSKSILTRLYYWVFHMIKSLVWITPFVYQQKPQIVQFYEKIMRNFLGSNYVSDIDVVEISSAQIKYLEKHHSVNRPSIRKCKSLISGIAYICQDYAYLPKHLEIFANTCDAYAIEIKPKTGWEPSAGGDRLSKCTYCRNQYLKLKSNRISSVSSYCPKDLFSGNLERMIAAINSLIANPQNNFQIIKNGATIYNWNTKSNSITDILSNLFSSNDSSDRLLEEFCILIQKCLTKSWDKSIKESCNDCLKTQKANDGYLRFETALPNGCVLERILMLQMLNQHGTKHYHSLIEKSKSSLPNYKYVDEILMDTNLSLPQSQCLKCTLVQLSEMCDLSESIHLNVAPYLLSSIARDVSIFLTLQRVDGSPTQNCDTNRNVFTVDSMYGEFVLNIGVVDLFPKPVSTIKKHCDMMDMFANHSSILKIF